MIFNQRHWVFGLFLLVFAGCATQSPTEKSLDTASAIPTNLSPAEVKNYHDALMRIEQGDAGNAIGSLKKLTQAHPAQPGIWLNLAIAQYQDKRLDDAKATLVHAQKLNEDIAAAHNLAGLIAVDQGDYRAAEKSYRTALKLNKQFAEAHYNLALLYDIFYQDIGQAVDHYQRYLVLTPEEDKATGAWVEELKLTLKRRGEG